MVCVKLLLKNNLSISDEEGLNLKWNIAQNFKKNTFENDEIYVPFVVSADIPVYFTCENSDSKIDTHMLVID